MYPVARWNTGDYLLLQSNTDFLDKLQTFSQFFTLGVRELERNIIVKKLKFLCDATHEFFPQNKHRVNEKRKFIFSTVDTFLWLFELCFWPFWVIA